MVGCSSRPSRTDERVEIESTKAVYDKILELRIANAQIIVNYAAFLEENQYFEESFKVYRKIMVVLCY